VTPAELAKEIRLIQISSSKAVNDILAGEYHSVFKGQGMEFEEVRPYQPGDEVRTIDWNVTARTGEPFVKRYREERELSVMFLVDLSASGDFGSARGKKNEIAARVCALLAFSAIKNNDKVGMLIFTDEIELFVPPAKGTSHVLRVIRELLGFQPKRSQTGIANALRHLGKITHKRSVVFLVSDFLDADFSRPLRMIAKRHDLVAVTMRDRLELKMPKAGLVVWEDAETGELVELDTSSAEVRGRFEKLAEARRREQIALFRSMNVDEIEIFTNSDYVRELVRFFRVRERRIRR